MDYLDDIDIAEFREIPTYKLMCICILKNDHACKYMGFALNKEEAYKRDKIMEQFKNCELWRSEWANVCNAHLKTENHIDHRSYARQGKLEIPTIHEGADARKIDEKFQNGQTYLHI